MNATRDDRHAPGGGRSGAQSGPGEAFDPLAPQDDDAGCDGDPGGAMPAPQTPLPPDELERLKKTPFDDSPSKVEGQIDPGGKR